MNTRGLTGLSTSRIADECIILRYVEFDEYDDGSVDPIIKDYEKKGSVRILQPREIERLEISGVICRNGITAVIKDASEFRPDSVVHDGKEYRVINWSFDYEQEMSDGWDENTELIGTVVATCDEITIQGA